MSVTTEQATVYRGGRRRWFSMKAAIRAEAKAIHRERFRKDCYCCDSEPGPYGAPGETCHLHEPSYFDRFTRRVGRLIERALTASTGEQK